VGFVECGGKRAFCVRRGGPPHSTKHQPPPPIHRNQINHSAIYHGDIIHAFAGTVFIPIHCEANLKFARPTSIVAAYLLLIATLIIAPSSRAQSSATLPQYTYAVDASSNAVLAFVSAPNGALSPLSPPSYPTGSGPNGVAVDPTGHFLYVVNILSDSVTGYAIALNGSLSPIPGSPWTTGSGPGWITIDPTGRFVYVANCAALCSGSGEGNVSGYAINKANGALSAIPGSPFPADEIPYSIAVDPTGSFAYVANYRSNTISVFKIDQCAGALWQSVKSTPTGGLSAITLSLDPHGRYLYVNNTASDNVSAFAVGNDGQLTAVSGSPFATGQFTQGIAFDPAGEYVYISAGDEVLGYVIKSGGALAPQSTSPYPSPGFLVALQLDKFGRHLYGSAGGTGAVVLKIAESNGSLSPEPGSPFHAGADTVFITTTTGR
jgi:DNA-binding beta-propeller fold protein YncE